MGWPDYSPLHERMLAEYVPGSGNADTRFGEILRCAANLTYQHYNNGAIVGIGVGKDWDYGIAFLSNCGVEDIEDIAMGIRRTVVRWGDFVDDDYTYDWSEEDEDEYDSNGDPKIPASVEEDYDAYLNELNDAVEKLCAEKEQDPWFLGPPAREPPRTESRNASPKRGRGFRTRSGMR